MLSLLSNLSLHYHHLLSLHNKFLLYFYLSPKKIHWKDLDVHKRGSEKEKEGI